MGRACVVGGVAACTTTIVLRVSVAALVLGLGMSSPRQPLRFRPTRGKANGGTFKAVQFSDLHLDSVGDQCGNASACIALTQGVMRTVLAAEAPVDFVIMAGDIACYTKACYDASVAPMREANVPWAFINGNHDTASSGRGWQLHYDVTLSGSHTAILDNSTSTYVVSVLQPTGAVTATNLWFFDSGDVECEGRNVNNNGCVSESQLSWLRAHPQPQAFGLAWVHIPVPEVMAVWANTNSTGESSNANSSSARSTRCILELSLL
jgi:hypothetical protein